MTLKIKKYNKKILYENKILFVHFQMGFYKYKIFFIGYLDLYKYHNFLKISFIEIIIKKYFYKNKLPSD